MVAMVTAEVLEALLPVELRPVVVIMVQVVVMMTMTNIIAVGGVVMLAMVTVAML